MSIQQQQRKLKIGLYGFGIVGEGLYKALQQTPTLNVEITGVCIRHAEKKRNAPASLFTTDREKLLNDPEINVVVELTNDPEAAFDIVSAALRKGKAVVSASKKMIADNLRELIALQQQYKTSFLYEAAACASIPVIRNLEEYYDNDLLQGLSGIVNGSTNYILTKVREHGLDFGTALLQAQLEGFAETDPSLDIEGSDAVHKLTLLLAHAYGILTTPASIVGSGIQYLKEQDVTFAREKGYKIKLVASARKLPDGTVAAYVLPQFVSKDSQLFQVEQEFNGVIIESSLADRQFFYGKGAGSFPTASAVLSDLSALRYDYRYEYKKLCYQDPFVLSGNFYLNVYVSFDKLFQVPQEAFEQISEWRSNEQGCYVTGILHISRLRDSQWWKKPGTSLIVLGEPFSGLPEPDATKTPAEQAFAYEEAAY